MAGERREYTPAEKQTMVNMHAFFAAEKRGGLFKGQRTIDLVANVMRCGPATVQRARAEYVADTTTNFELAPTSRGRKRAYDVLEIAPTIHDYIVTQNELGMPTTAQSISDEVDALHDVRLGIHTMSRLLYDLNYHHLRGEKRHIHADSPGNVKFHADYLAKKVANRLVVQGAHGPEVSGVTRPEVFLDESYCNVNHVTGKTWLTSDKIRYGKTGRGQRVCIIAAGIIKTTGCVTTGEFVEGMTEVWNSSLKRVQWDEDDYHGNFDAPQFERWFEKLCRVLTEKHGACTIHMDGASYHKRITKKSPTKSWREAEIVEWMNESFERAFDPTATIPTLLALVEQHRPTPIYAATTIATKYNHLVYFTPPYHPTLQPIELIWGAIKGEIAQAPAKNATDLVAKVWAALEKHTSLWLSVFRHTQVNEDSFLAADQARE